MKIGEIYNELVKLPFHEVQKEAPYMSYGHYQRLRLLLGIDEIIIES